MSHRMQFRDSGPLRVAEIDCHGCEGSGSLTDPRCRGCVLEQLGAEGGADRTTLKRAYHRVYCSPRLSALALALTGIKQLMFDRTLYAPSEDGKCRRCVGERYERLTGLWPHLLRYPHDLAPLEKLKGSQGKLGKECSRCTAEHFSRLLKSVEAGLKGLDFMRGLERGDYDGVFEARTKPFFIECIWHPPPQKARLLDSYELPEERGVVRIYEQPNRPIPLYELDLPEFGWPAEHVELLDRAYGLEIKGAPGHARFARPARVAGFAEEWYRVLLQVARESSGMRIPSADLRELAKRIAGWLAYRVLEPLSHDDHLTDIFVPAPPELQPIRVVHDRWDQCETRVYWSTPSLHALAETLASRLGTSFDEVRPQLDVEIPELGMRLFLARHPAVWPQSTGLAIRKRRLKAWTQPLFLERGTLTPLASSLISNLIRRGSSAFIIGEVGSAKTSTVETLVPEIGTHKRIICYQDTEELHIEDFVTHGHSIENVRITSAEQLQRQIDAFLRGGPAYWLITEVRETEAVRAALGAAARQGSQPLVSSFHARTKREMYDLVSHIMGLHRAVYKYIDLIISTARFSTREGAIRRVIEVAEVLKEWEEKPEYVELFLDDRKRDLLRAQNLLKGDKRLIEQLNSYDLTKLDVLAAAKRVEFLPPEAGGSHLVQRICKGFAIEPGDLLVEVLSEAKMKSTLLELALRSRDTSYLELPFVSKAYDAYFAASKHAPDFGRALEEWRAWLKRA